ncbi:MAG: hypothetical protein JST51_08400 [Armatimonadetes bacterium]|nr:hypothetical protein [Armatimonadota bacterium]
MLSAVLLLALQSKTLNYDIYRGSDLIGEAKILIKITQDGGKRTDTKLTLKLSGKTLDMHTTQVWAFSGRPTLKIVQMFDAKGNETHRTRADFKADEVSVMETVGDKTTKKTVPIAADAEIRELSEFWFLRDEPVKDESFKFQSFDASTQKWQTATSTYIGIESKVVDGKKMVLYHVAQEIGTKKVDVWLDTDGFPLITESSDKTKIVAKF